MSVRAKREYLRAIHARSQRAARQAKGQILDEGWTRRPALSGRRRGGGSTAGRPGDPPRRRRRAAT